MSTLSALETFAGDPTAVPHLATCSGCSSCSSFRLVIVDADTGQSVRIPRAARRVFGVEDVAGALLAAEQPSGAESPVPVGEEPAHGSRCAHEWRNGLGHHECMKRVHGEDVRHRCECDEVTA